MLLNCRRRYAAPSTIAAVMRTMCVSLFNTASTCMCAISHTPTECRSSSQRGPGSTCDASHQCRGDVPASRLPAPPTQPAASKNVAPANWERPMIARASAVKTSLRIAGRVVSCTSTQGVPPEEHACAAPAAVTTAPNWAQSVQRSAVPVGAPAAFRRKLPTGGSTASGVVDCTTTPPGRHRVTV